MSVDTKLCLFHGTSSKFKSKIMRSGILPRSEHGNSTYDGDLVSPENRVFLTDVYAVHFALIAANRYGGIPMVVRTHVDIDRLEPDTDFQEGGKHDLKFQPDEWEDCLHKTGCLSVVGAVSPEEISRIYVVDRRRSEWREMNRQGAFDRIETRLRHYVSHEANQQNMEWVLMFGSNQFDHVDGAWRAERF